ncbi:hypothetical protein [Paracoccus sp. (in: a-proteobacteria)]|uniref:hypothetical protein n=1 Tax=Paracoccus sp. TaxID=267 RepID=UPI0028983E16|nr:hypothetical protein [Paracoccus sp. (in: a-proteobacteria)]
MTHTTLTHAGDRQHVPTDQAAPERIWLDLPSFNKADRWALSTGHRKDGWPEYVRSDLAAPSAPARERCGSCGAFGRKCYGNGPEGPDCDEWVGETDGRACCYACYGADPAPAEVDGLVERLRVKGRMVREQINHHIRRMEVERIEAATALTAQQAEIERLRGLERDTYATWKKVAADLQARAEKAEAERDAAEEREFNRGYLIACCNLTNLHDMPEVGFDVLRELGLRKAQVDGFGLSEYDAEALRNIEKGRGGSVYADNAIAKLKGDV